ncbi:MAG: hypothetical protein K9L68_06365, partial [Spirochaetales bacterium]|nr:hypothetical protein [Spirochaetales bacterium]MCF7938206.1 hypothetical protein [Spirochaetales bacterium]
FLKGEVRRAETAYNRGLELYPEDVGLKIAYAEFLCRQEQHLEARNLLDIPEEGLEEAKQRQIRRLKGEIREKTEERTVCALCGREWWSPKALPEQPPLKLHGEPPGESPAGRCPSCGKVYCVSCAKEYLQGSRFTCPDCGEPLKLSDGPLRYLVAGYVELSKPD